MIPRPGRGASRRGRAAHDPSQPGLGIYRARGLRAPLRGGLSAPWKAWIQTARLPAADPRTRLQAGRQAAFGRDLAAEFGMNRGAACEALIRLDTLRIVESRPKSGILPSPTPSACIGRWSVCTRPTRRCRPPRQRSQSSCAALLERGDAPACLRRNDEDLAPAPDPQQRAKRRSRAGRASRPGRRVPKAIVAATHQRRAAAPLINVFLPDVAQAAWCTSTHVRQRSHAQVVQLYHQAIEAQDAEAGRQILPPPEGVDAYFRMFADWRPTRAPATGAPAKARRTTPRRTAAAPDSVCARARTGPDPPPQAIHPEAAAAAPGELVTAADTRSDTLRRSVCGLRGRRGARQAGMTSSSPRRA